MLGWLFSQPLPPGTPAPDFTLPDESGKPVSLAEFRGRPVVLIFYPGDNTPVCTRQMCEVRDQWNLVRAAGAAVLGINPQSTASHRKFRERRRLPFPLLVDEGQRAAAAYHARGWLVRRTVYAVAADGLVVFARRGRPPLSTVLASFGDRNRSAKL